MKFKNRPKWFRDVTDTSPEAANNAMGRLFPSEEWDQANIEERFAEALKRAKENNTWPFVSSDNND